MKRFIPFFALLLAAAMFFGCRSQKAVHCPAFDPADFRQWFPYNKNDQFRFRSLSTGNTYTLQIEDVIYSAAYTNQPALLYSIDRSCNQTATVVSDSISISYTLYNAGPEGPLNSAMLMLSVARGSFSLGKVTGDEVSANPVPQVHDNVSYQDNAAVYPGGQQYPRLAIITSHLTHSFSHAETVYVGKGIGVVGYKLRESGEIWVREP